MEFMEVMDLSLWTVAPRVLPDESTNLFKIEDRSPKLGLSSQLLLWCVCCRLPQSLWRCWAPQPGCGRCCSHTGP